MNREIDTQVHKHIHNEWMDDGQVDSGSWMYDRQTDNLDRQMIG